MNTFVMTANRLRDGQTVYLDQQDRWVEVLEAARAITEEERASAETEAASRDNQLNVVGPYLLQVDVAKGAPAPLSMRETIRASGVPTIVPPSDADIAVRRAAA